MKLFTNEEREMLSEATVACGTPLGDLLENTALECADEIASRRRSDSPLITFAGPGNNGAVALAITRILSLRGFRSRIFLFNIGGDRLTDECRMQRDLVSDVAGIELNEVTSNFSLPDIDPKATVVDGLFGWGLRSPLEGGFTVLVRYINESRAYVVSVDVPSGMVGDWNIGGVNRDIIHASLTLCVQSPRPSFMLRENAGLVGRWKVVGSGFSREQMLETKPSIYLIEQRDVSRNLRPRSPWCSKADFGSAIIVAGSYGMMGAAVMAARGALRAGAGKVTVMSPRCGFNIVQTAVPEAMFLADNGDVHINSLTIPAGFKSIAVGPGIGTAPQTIEALDNFLAQAQLPLVIDADALNCIARRPTMLNNIPVLSIITPHEGEFDRLFGAQPSSAARIMKAREVARSFNIFVVIKGHHTAIVRPDGKVYFNSSGSPAMATPGAGDVLTGLIAGLLAQGYLPEIAAIIGVYLHGLAGEIAAERLGPYSVGASDIADCIADAYTSIINSES